MQEVFILSLLVGGLAALIAKDGGVDYLLHAITSRIKSTRGAEAGIGALVSVADICTAKQYGGNCHNRSHGKANCR